MTNVKKVIDYIASGFALYMILFAYGFYITFIMIIRNIFNLSIPSYLIITQYQHMGMFLAGLMLLSFVVYPLRKDGPKWYDWLLGIVGASSGLYIFIMYPQLMQRMGIVTPLDMLFGLIAIIFIIEAGRRSIGLAIALLTLVFVVYGAYDAGFRLDELVARIYLYNVGIFSTPFHVATFMIFIFMFFGNLISELGVGEYINSLAFSVAGSRKGGPAKVAVVASSLMGMMSGSATGNVVTTGSFTIPLMKKFGYKPEIAAAIEASASTGGQIMPPVLGSAAFIMPLFLGLRYWDIVVASIIPALLYYSVLYIFVDQEASKQGLFGLPKDQIPPLKPLLFRFYYLLPIAVLVAVLAQGFDVEQAAIAAILSALFLEWFTRRNLSRIYSLIFILIIFLFGCMFTWQGLDIYATLILLGSIAIIITLLIGIILKGAKEMTTITLKALSRTFKGIIGVALACAMAGIIAGVLAYTGLAVTMSKSLVAITGGNLFLLLLLSMAIALVLGMGMPTPAVYVLGATLIAPALVTVGINPLAAHYFIFYFGVLAPLTPPVAVTAYAGAAIAKADFWKTGLQAFRMAITGWFIAFSFARYPEMLIVPIQSLSLNTIINIIVGILASMLGGISTHAIASGYFLGKLSTINRIVFAIAILFVVLSIFYNTIFIVPAIISVILGIPKVVSIFKK